MTIIDVFMILPLWARIIIGVLLIIWALELFLMPFKAGLSIQRYKNIEHLLKEILEASRVDTKKFENMSDSVSILFGLLGMQRKEEKNDNKSEPHR